MKKIYPFLLVLSILAAACASPQTPAVSPESPTATEAIPEPTVTGTAEPTAAPTEAPAETTAPTEAVGDQLPDRFQACVIMEPAVPLPLRWVYLDAGDLWVWAEGGEPISLTGTGDVTVVALSPVDDRIVFVRKTDAGPATLWAAAPDGSETVELTAGSDLAGSIELHGFSFDGSKIAFTHLLTETTGELWAADLDGSGALRLVDQATLMEIVLEPLADGALPAGVTWLPGTHVLTFDAAPTFEADGIYIYVQEQVWYADSDSGSVAVKFPEGEGGSVSYSPDGTMMLLTSPDGAQVMNIELGIPEPLDVPYAQIGFGEFYAAPALVWTADSSAILVALLEEGEEPYASDHRVTIWRAPVDGSPGEALLTLEGFFPTFVFSPNRDKVAFWRAETGSPNERELHIAEIDGGEHIIYATGRLLEFLGWSRFDQQFVYGFFEEGRAFTGDLCADPVPLEAGYPFGLRWLDTLTFVFEIHDVDGGRLEVYEGGPDGSAELRLNLELGSWFGVELIEE